MNGRVLLWVGLFLAGVAAYGLLAVRGAVAQEEEPRIDGVPASSIANNFPGRADFGGVRKSLSERGITYGAIYTGEVLSNLSGGIRRGTIFEGKLENQLNVDLEKLVGWNGLNLYANTFQIHGTGGMRRDYVGNLITISNIEALPSTRLSELWLEQKFFNDKVGIRFGQLAVDSEFFFASRADPLINNDWPTITSSNLPSGGPAYPLSTPGVRVKIEPSKDVSLLAAVFNGDPAGPGPGDEQKRNCCGLNFRVSDPPFVIGEAQFRYNQEKDATGLAGTLKLGAWTHFGRFDDQRFGTDGLSLAAPASNGMPAQLRGNWGLYGVIDQQIYRPPGGDKDSGIAVLSRISASPSDRNLIELYLDAGLLFAGFVPGRPNDKFAAEVIYSRISDRARAFDRDVVRLAGLPQPLRDYEATLELTYQVQIMPGWTVQPDFQYVFYPSGRVQDPFALPGAAIRNAMIFGVRSVVKY